MRVVVLTGAGISRESGLHTFRDTDGIWSRYRLEDVCTPEGFARDPALVHGFYNARRTELTGGGTQPNAAHLALAGLEDAARTGRWPGKLLIVTQNIDDLHERAGSRSVLHMHGALRRARCTDCEAVLAWDGDTGEDSVCPCCAATGALRPDVVWFGEMPMHMDAIESALAACDLFVAIGTSGTVYPAAGFVRLARTAGARTLELNLEPSEGAALFDTRRTGPATRLVPDLVADLLAERPFCPPAERLL